MRLLGSVCAFVLALGGASAFAQTSDGVKYEVSATIGGDYEFPDDAWTPAFEQETIEGTLTLAASQGNWKAALSYVESEDDVGYGASVRYKNKHCHEDIVCTVTLKWRDIGDVSSTLSYTAGVSIPWEWAKRDWVSPSFNIEANGVAGDASETAVSGALELEFPLWDGPDAGFGLTLQGGVSHAFEMDDTEPTWGAGLTYTLPLGDAGEGRAVEFSIEYESVLTLDENDEFDFEREAKAGITLRF